MAKNRKKRGVRHVHPKRDKVELFDDETGEKLGVVYINKLFGCRKMVTRWDFDKKVRIEFGQTTETA